MTEIVGLKNFVQDDVNKLIAKFVGVKPHPVAKLLKPLIEEYYLRLPEAETFFASNFLFYKKRCYRCDDRLDDVKDEEDTEEEEDDDGIRRNCRKQWDNHFKLCYYCFDDCYFCPRCHEALTPEEMELTDERPRLCNQCDEEENETTDEESEEDNEEYEEYLNEQRVDLEGWGG